jgi:hypothetical protein
MMLFVALQRVHDAHSAQTLGIDSWERQRPRCPA